MAVKTLLLLALAVSSVLTYDGDKKENIKNYYADDYDYTYDDEPDEDKVVKKNEEITSREENSIEVTTYKTTTIRAATYEVTENVVDIPDNSTRIGPVVVNYTTPQPLNNANIPNAVINISDLTTNSNNHYGFVTEPDKESTKTKKNYFSIFHVKAEYDDKPNRPTIDYDNARPSGFKEYVLGLKRGIINGLYKLFKGKHRHEDVSHEYLSDHQETYHKYQGDIPYPNRFNHEFKHNVEEDDEYD